VSTEESQWTNLNVIGLCIPPPIELLRDWTMMRLKSFSTKREAQNYRQDLAALMDFKNNCHVPA